MDAAPFLGAGRAADAPLSMSDAGTLDYHDAERRAGVRRLSRAERVARWRERRPMLAEDPAEAEVEMIAPSWRADAAPRPPCELTPLGERLVGLVDWPSDAAAEAEPGDGAACEGGQPDAGGAT